MAAVERTFEADGIALETRAALARVATAPALRPCGKHTDCGTATVTLPVEKVDAPNPLALLFARHSQALVTVWIYRSATDARKAKAAFQSLRLNVGSYLVHNNVMVGYVLVPRSDTKWFARVKHALERV